MVERIGDLEIDQDLAFQRREWLVQRIAWIVLFAVVGLALAGLFGHGPVSSTSSTSDDGRLRVEHPRFLRSTMPAELVVEADAALAVDGAFEVEITTDYVHAFEVEVVNPTPKEVQVLDGALRYVFTRAEAPADLRAVFHTRVRDVGPIEGVVTVSGRAVRVSQFVYP